MRTNVELQLLIAVYLTQDGADRALEKLRALAAEGILRIAELAVIKRETTSGVIQLRNEVPDSTPSQGPTEVARSVTGIVFPSSELMSDLICSFVPASLGLTRDQGRHRAELLRAIGNMSQGSSALAVVAEEHLVARLKAGSSGRYALLDCTADADEVAALQIRVRE